MLMLIFQDTILSLVASVISNDGRVRIGDWIEMPSQNADGDVIDIARYTVTVQNWDKTITTVPTKNLISHSFKNWRGMSESGGRRIKRALYLDQRSVRFLDDEEVARMRRFTLIDDYLDRKAAELRDWNARLAERGAEPVNRRRVTNLGTFRAYVEQYLRHHPGVNQGMTLMVRQLQPTDAGLPLEIYCFTADVRWAFYEGIQSDIFDHLLAILPEFGLRVFQRMATARCRSTCGGLPAVQPVRLPPLSGGDSPRRARIGDRAPSRSARHRYPVSAATRARRPSAARSCASAPRWWSRRSTASRGRLRGPRLLNAAAALETDLTRTRSTPGCTRSRRPRPRPQRPALQRSHRHRHRAVRRPGRRRPGPGHAGTTPILRCRVTSCATPSCSSRWPTSP